jgi:hypothetical protein
MNNFQQQANVNPLTSFMRQPKIYISLPSQGVYWEEGSLLIPENLEFPVFSMTAKDELAFKTPDALMNGQAIIDVIQSCMPNVKDAWKTPSVDLDTILISIRIATYGEMMDIKHTVPGTTEEVEHAIDLRTVLDRITQNTTWKETVEITPELTCFVYPLTYRHITMTSLRTFETQRIMQTVNNDNLTDEQKLTIFNESFNKLSDITIDLVADSIKYIKTPDNVVHNKEFIREFLKNSDKSVYEKIQKHLSSLKESNGLKPFLLESSEEHIALGAPATYELPLSIDNSDFFGQGS